VLLGEVVTARNVTARNEEGGPLLHYAGRLHDGTLRILPREATHSPGQVAALGRS
jgi:hypothetical protein